MMKASDIYKIYLRATMLPVDKLVEVTIEKVTIEEIHPRPGITKKAIVLSFKGKVARLVLNQTNANKLYLIAGDDLEGWPGVVVSLRRDMWGDKPTVIIEAHKNGNGGNNQ